LEQSYEKILKGEKGYSIYHRDVHNRLQSSYENGKYDVDAIPGKDIITTIDGELQQYGELLMQNKVGSLVAIEPSSGEILALVTSPGINTEMLSAINKYYNELVSNPHKPMFNRAVMSTSPPGSVFKIVNGLIGLQEGIINENTCYTCNMGYYYNNRRLGCHAHTPTINFTQSIMMSCNAYYCYVFKALIDNPKYSSTTTSLNHWRNMVMSFGFGKKLGTDFPSELSGNIPSASLYNKIYGKNRWKANTVISLSIGQGELEITPLHLANFAATLANRGYYYIPHLVKEIKNSSIDKKYKVKQYTAVDTAHFKKVIRGMYLAVNNPGGGGTAGLAMLPGVDICGKTGTVQNPHGDNNSVFICFAPMDNPKIAIAAYIENAGYGGAWAAPIASLLVEKYLSGDVLRKELEERIINANLMNKAPIK
jgi:Cell division protein FtsI/penicillin-binding protein 2